MQTEDVNEGITNGRCSRKRGEILSCTSKSLQGTDWGFAKLAAKVPRVAGRRYRVSYRFPNLIDRIRLILPRGKIAPSEGQSDLEANFEAEASDGSTEDASSANEDDGQSAERPYNTLLQLLNAKPDPEEPVLKKRKLECKDKESHPRKSGQEVVETKLLDLVEDLQDGPVSDDESLSESMQDAEAGDRGEGYDGNRLSVAVIGDV